MANPVTLRAPLGALILLTLGVVGTEPARAQRGLLLGPGAEFVGAGVSRLATGELDGRLAAQGYPTFGRTPLALSLGGHRILSSRLMLGAEWHGIIHGNEEHEGREVGLGGGYGTLALGYAVELSPRARVYPRLGLGGGGMGVWIETPRDAVGFDEVLGDPDSHQDHVVGPDRQTTLSTGGMVVDLGAGGELLSRRGGRGPMIGLRLGYLAMPFRPSWRQFERPVSGGPRATLAGPYVRVVIGTGRGR